MNHTGVTSLTPQRDAAVDCLAAAQVYNDQIRRFEELRADNPERSAQYSRMIGETNARLGYAIKVAEVHATLAVADALGDFMDVVGDTGILDFESDAFGAPVEGCDQ